MSQIHANFLLFHSLGGWWSTIVVQCKTFCHAGRKEPFTCEPRTQTLGPKCEINYLYNCYERAIIVANGTWYQMYKA